MAAPNDPPPNIQSNTNANAGLSNVTAHIQSDGSSKQKDAQFLKCILKKCQLPMYDNWNAPGEPKKHTKLRPDITRFALHFSFSL